LIKSTLAKQPNISDFCLFQADKPQSKYSFVLFFLIEEITPKIAFNLNQAINFTTTVFYD